MSNFFRPKKESNNLHVYLLSGIALIMFVIGAWMIWHSADVSTFTTGITSLVEKKEFNLKDYEQQFENKYGKDYICVYNHQTAILECKYPIYQPLGVPKE